MSKDISDIQAIIKNLNFAKEQNLRNDPLFYYLNFEQIKTFSEQLSEAKALLTELILSEYETETLIAKGNDGNPVNRKKDNFNIKIHFPERVYWRQEELKRLAEKIREQGFPPEEHLDAYYSISPERWKNLDSVTRSRFEMFRVVELGEPVIVISSRMEEK